jgi:hypothetical protein
MKAHVKNVFVVKVLAKNVPNQHAACVVYLGITA